MTDTLREKRMKQFAREAGEVILPYFRSPLAVDDKSAGAAFDPVTEADRAAERLLRRRIEEHYPSHGIFGEEYGRVRETAEFQWVLDPIDGTRSFISGLPTWGTLIGLLHGGKPSAGVMYQSFTDELYFGDAHGATLERGAEKVTLKTRACATLAEATVSTTSPLNFTAAGYEAYRRVEAAARTSRYGYDCYAYCMVAAGHIDVVIESGLKLYDIAALIPIIEGAGGIVTDWRGNSLPDFKGDIVACGDKRLHEQVIMALGK
jgi:myo-inositol-1(or 4)-monophosphatase